MPMTAQVSQSGILAATVAAQSHTVIGVEDAAALVGVSLRTAYTNADEMFSVIRIGKTMRVATLPLLATLGIDPPSLAGDVAEAVSAARSQPTISVPQACTLYDVAPSTLRAYIRAGGMQAIDVGRTMRIPAVHVLRELGIERR